MDQQQSLGLPPLSRVRLDELLQELLDRVSDAMASRERLRNLLDAVVGIGSDLDLRSTLERIVVAVCQLTDARFGATGVVGPDRRLSEFTTHGIGPRLRAEGGDLPTGHGVLGLLIDDPRPVRIHDIATHPLSTGFPPHHPAMRSFLGVPAPIRDQVFGNLYLAEKRGATDFTDDDEEITVALAVAAGAAVENACLYALAQRRQRWLAATIEITAALSADTSTDQALTLVARRAREVAEAELVVLLLHDEAAGTLTVSLRQGRTTAAHATCSSTPTPTTPTRGCRPAKRCQQFCLRRSPPGCPPHPSATSPNCPPPETSCAPCYPASATRR